MILRGWYIYISEIVLISIQNSRQEKVKEYSRVVTQVNSPFGKINVTLVQGYVAIGVHNNINATVMKRFALTWRPVQRILGALESEEQPIWDQSVSFTLGHIDSSLMVKSDKTEYLLRKN